MITKEEERKALEKIRKIVEGLGEGSYLSMAFEGCFEDAEENIENDFGCSWKQRAELEVKRNDDMAERIVLLNKTIDDKNAELADLKARNERLSKAILQADDITDCMTLIDNQMCEDEKKAGNAAKQIVEFADSPNSVTFKQAVAEHRTMKAKAEYWRKLYERLNYAFCNLLEIAGKTDLEV